MRKAASCCCFVAELRIFPCQAPKIFQRMCPRWNIGRTEFSCHVRRQIPTTRTLGQHCTKPVLPCAFCLICTHKSRLLPNSPIVAGSCDTSDFLHPVLTEIVKDLSDFPQRWWLPTTVPVQYRQAKPRSHASPGEMTRQNKVLSVSP